MPHIRIATLALCGLFGVLAEIFFFLFNFVLSFALFRSCNFSKTEFDCERSRNFALCYRNLRCKNLAGKRSTPVS